MCSVSLLGLPVNYSGVGCPNLDTMPTLFFVVGLLEDVKLIIKGPVRQTNSILTSSEGELTASWDVTQVHSNLRVQGEAPGRLHLAAWVAAEVVTPVQLGVVLGHVVTVRVLGGPRLAVVARLGHAHRALVVGATAVVAAVVGRGVCEVERDFSEGLKALGKY